MWRTAARVSSGNASVSDGIGNRGIVSLLPMRSQDQACARTLFIHDRRPWIIHVSMLRWFGSDGQHFHAARGFEAMPTSLRNDHQHACRQLQGLQDLIDENIKAGGPLKNLHDLIPLWMPLPS